MTSPTSRSAAAYPDHFADVSKMIRYRPTCVPAGDLCLVDDQFEISPLRVAQQILQLAGQPELN
jgi:hypothetical protein